MPIKSSLKFLTPGLVTLLACLTPPIHAQDKLLLGKLPNKQCIDMVLQAKDEFASENQRYWFARVPPYVGVKNGEPLMAGGDGTCYVGFPKASSDSAVVIVNGRVINVIVQTPSKEEAVTTYKSKDGHTVVVVRVTGAESTCDPGGEKCCGDYTYATITVSQGNKSVSVKAARYEGG